MDDNRLIERIVVLETKQDDMREDIREIKGNLRSLMELASRGRGSLSAMLWAGGFVSALLALGTSIYGYMAGQK